MEQEYWQEIETAEVLNTVEFELIEKPQGKQRPRFSSFGRGVRVYTPSKTKDYENMVKWAYKQHSQTTTTTTATAVKVYIQAFLHKPKTLKRPRYAMSKPDIDNIIKIILDGLNEVAYQDDKQVVYTTAMKTYHKDKSYAPRVCVKLEFVL